MRTSDLVRLVALAAIWGGSFALMRVTTPIFGGIGTMWLRIGIGGSALLLYAWIIRAELGAARYWRHYLLVGLLSSAVPFALFGYAMQTLPASYGAMLNALAPLFGALFAALMLGEKLNRWRCAGLVISFGGVAMIVNLGPIEVTPRVLLAAGACVLATALYGFVGVYIKRYVHGAPNLGMAGCTLAFASIASAPIAVSATTWALPSLPVALATLALGLLCSGVAYLLYYRLIADLGPTKAISVTFLIPVFGVFWGTVFLKETLTLGSVAGGTTILLGMALVLQLLPLRSPGVDLHQPTK